MNDDEVLFVSPVLRHAVHTPSTRSTSLATIREGFAYRPHLDGLRAIAVLAVVLFHCSVPGFSHGYLGVDTFFVMSGFLITSLLLIEVERTGTIELSHFYAKRVRRLMPAFVLVVLVTAVAYKLLLTASEVEEVRGSFHAAALYVENFYEINVADDYWKQEYDTSPLRHCWSLSVEEQFYFFFSLCLKVMFAWLHAVQFRRTSAGFYRRLYAKVSLVVSIVIAVSLFRGAVLLETSSATTAYMDSIARVYQLLTGTMLALRAAFDRVSASSRARIDAMWVNIAFVLLLALYCAGLVLTSVNTLVAGIVSTALSASLIELSEGHTAASCAAVAVLSNNVGVFLGKLSYGIYLWHFPLIVLLDKLVWGSAAVGGFSWRFVQALVVATLAIALAYITRRFVEGPVSKISVSRGSTARWCFALGVVLVPMVLVVSLSSILWTPSLGSNEYVDIGRRSSNLTLGPYEIKFENVFEGSEVDTVKRNFQCCKKGPCVEKAPNRTSDTIVALAGDSHARMVYPMWKHAAVRLGMELRFCSASATAPFKPIVPGGKNVKDYSPYFHEFSEAPDYLVIHAYQLQCLMGLEQNLNGNCFEGPSAVRMNEIASEELEDHIAELPDVKDDFIARTSAWLDVVDARAMKKVFFVLPEPIADFWIPHCKTDCDYPVNHWISRVLVERWLEEIAKVFPNVVLVDMDEVLCPKGVCPGKLPSGKPSSTDYHHIHTLRWFAVANDYWSVLQSMGMVL